MKVTPIKASIEASFRILDSKNPMRIASHKDSKLTDTQIKVKLEQMDKQTLTDTVVILDEEDITRTIIQTKEIESTEETEIEKQQLEEIITSIEKTKKNIIDVASKLQTEISGKGKEEKENLQPRVRILKDKKLTINKPDTSAIRRTTRVTKRRIQNVDLEHTSSEDSDKENQETNKEIVKNIFKNNKKPIKTPIKKIYISADRIISANLSKSTEMGRVMQPTAKPCPGRSEKEKRTEQTIMDEQKSTQEQDIDDMERANKAKGRRIETTKGIEEAENAK